MLYKIPIFIFFCYAGVFKWAETNQAPEYENWQTGEPNNENDNEDCVMTTHVDDGSFKWYDVPCNINVEGTDLPLFALCVPCHALRQ